MKKTIATLLLTLATTMVSAQDAMPNYAELKSALSLEQKAPRQSFGYLKLGVSDSQLSGNIRHLETPSFDGAVPSLGAGYRHNLGFGAIDVSASFNHRETQNTFTLPKVNYLHYLSPSKNNSLYAGLGCAFGGNYAQGEREFLGLVPNATVGYEMNRTASWRSFAQLDVSQPVFAVANNWLTLPAALPKTAVELAFGVGF